MAGRAPHGRWEASRGRPRANPGAFERESIIPDRSERKRRRQLRPARVRARYLILGVRERSPEGLVTHNEPADPLIWNQNATI